MADPQQYYSGDALAVSPGSVGHYNPDGSFTWDTGDHAGKSISAVQAKDNGDLISAFDSGNPNRQQAATQINQGKEGGVQGSTNILGLNTDPSAGVDVMNAPGANLDPTMSNADRGLLQGQANALSNQAQTGNGAWQQALKTANLNSQNTAQALGQSGSSLSGNEDALRNIGNAQGASQQQSAGQANILAAQQRQSALGQLGQLYAGENGTDAQQATSAAAAKQAAHTADVTLQQQGQKNTLGFIGGVGGAAAHALSRGGPVPGKPRVFGDNEKNDVVPAKLSPGEIVIPRSVTEGPDPVGGAAAFVAAIKQHKRGSGNFDGGGTLGNAFGLGGIGGNNTEAQQAYDAKDPTAKGNGVNWLGNFQQGASPMNGAVLDTTQTQGSRNGVLNVAGQQQYLADGNGGGNFSAVPQQMQNATDSSIAGAMGARRPGAAALIGATSGLQAEGGHLAEQKQKETIAASQAFSQAIQQQRARDLALAQAQQQALWRNSENNIGITLDQQNSMRNLFAGAGQGAVALASAAGKGTPTTNATPTSTDSLPGDENAPAPGEGDESYYAPGGEGGYSDGGEVKHTKKSRDFIAALRAQR